MISGCIAKVSILTNDWNYQIPVSINMCYYSENNFFRGFLYRDMLLNNLEHDNTVLEHAYAVLEYAYTVLEHVYAV